MRARRPGSAADPLKWRSALNSGTADHCQGGPTLAGRVARELGTPVRTEGGRGLTHVFPTAQGHLRAGGPVFRNWGHGDYRRGQYHFHACRESWRAVLSRLSGRTRNSRAADGTLGMHRLDRFWRCGRPAGPMHFSGDGSRHQKGAGAPGRSRNPGPIAERWRRLARSYSL